LLSHSRARFTLPTRWKVSATALLATVLALPRLAGAGAWLPAPGEHYSLIGGSYFASDGYYDSNGDRLPLNQGGLHEEKAIYSYNEFGWTKGRSFILGFPYLNVTRRLGAPSDSERTETGLGDLLLGVRFKIKGGAQAMSAEADWAPPLGYNRNLVPRLGDGASSLIGKFLYGAPLGHAGFVDLMGGYRFYLDKLAPTNQLLASATVAWWIGKAVLLSGEYNGQFGASSSDTLYRALYVKTPDGRPWTTSEAAPYTTTDQINIQTLSPMLLYRIDDHIDVMAGSSHTLSAKNALHIDRVYVAIALRQTKLGPLQGFMGGRR